MASFDLVTAPAHLGLGATVVVEPPWGGGLDWYAAYGARRASDGVEGRLVSMYTFDASWTSWEMHPAGEELVVCTAGALTLIQALPDGEHRVILRPGEAAINPRGVWHTADVAPGAVATALFITAGVGTDHKPR